MVPTFSHLLPRFYYTDVDCSGDSCSSSLSTALIIAIVVILIIKIIFWGWLVHHCMKRRRNMAREGDEKRNNNGNAPSWTALMTPTHQQQDDIADLPAYEPPRRTPYTSLPSYDGPNYHGYGVAQQEAPMEMKPTHVRNTSYGGARFGEPGKAGGS
ncbi:hypothetical protein Tdes44962_MAKER00626 [Teratosphaeria destructans]|uniref:Uncharacterized protein n=1 Tax=Teratosphaeria destructans TaxID=418781 RepID=A0A9W7W0K0_9PEZI|nr:hypothetical protein Tdes44962_MAKER00626 [Teratosphaeria destructans]